MASETSSPQATQKQGKRSGVLGHLFNIYRLIWKELRSIRADPMMLILVAYSFSLAVYTVATGASTEAKDLTVGVVDEDRSDLSRSLLTSQRIEICAEDARWRHGWTSVNRVQGKA